MEMTFQGYELSDDRSRVDLDKVCELLRDTYWAADRSRELTALSIRNSLCFTVLFEGRMVGFARILSDHGATSYLCDVVIDPQHRGRGVGDWLISCILRHPDVIHTRMLLITRDAQAFYRPFGFATHPFECMVRPRGVAPADPPRGGGD